MKLSEKAANENAFLEGIIATIKEEVAKNNPLGGVLQLVQTPPAQAPAEENDTETEEAVFDFLDSF